MKHMLYSFCLLLNYLSVIAGYTSTCPAGTNRALRLTTDRTIYITGEYIYFSAFITSDASAGGKNEWTVLYVELITPSVNRVTGGKFLVQELKSGGCLRIPSELSSGIYYLRAYTQGLRSLGPDYYAYVQVKLVNPLKKDVLTSQSSLTGITADRIPAIAEPGISLSPDKAAYTQHETIRLHYKLPQGLKSELRDMVMTVIPDSSMQIRPLEIIPGTENSNTGARIADVPGISLTGTIIDQKSRQPLISRRINLSVLGENDFMAVNSDSAGRFFFQLPPYTGDRDLFLSSFQDPEQSISLKIDNDFCTRKIDLPSPPFQLNQKEKEVVLEMARNLQIKNAFQPDTVRTAAVKTEKSVAFYGKPYSVLHLDSYIQLPTMEEYFNEIPGAVRIKKKNGAVRFQFTGEQTEMSMYEPLVLIDYVAIDNESVLKIPPQDIERIELVNSPYIKGSITYGGIISIFSKKNNFAGIDLPKSGVFVRYSLISNNCPEQITDPSPQLPDTRNTFLWIPHLPIIENQAILFTAPEVPGRYSIILKGIKKDGGLATWQASFEVR